MATITLTYDGRNPLARAMINTLRMMNVFKVEESKRVIVDDNAQHYDSELIAIVENGRKNRDKAKVIKVEDLWK